MKIKEIVPKPSDALEAMIKGLQKHSKRKTFEINMSDFGDYDPITKVCYGCAATCTVQEIAGVSFTRKEHIEWLGQRLKKTKLDETESSLQEFEFAIDNARKGDFRRLFDFYEIPRTENYNLLDQPIYMESNNWQTQVPGMKQIIKEFKAIGL